MATLATSRTPVETLDVLATFGQALQGFLDELAVNIDVHRHISAFPKPATRHTIIIETHELRTHDRVEVNIITGHVVAVTTLRLNDTKEEQ